MKKYDAFISYRKSTAAYADLVYFSLVAEGISKQRVFQDKHNIGPEQFDEKIKKAIEESNSLVLIVSKDCFVKKNDDDWFLKEIKVALDNNIPIIPILFDSVNSLTDPNIIQSLKDNFTSKDVSYLIRQQYVRYDSDYSQSSLEKACTFVRQVLENEKLSWKEKMFKNVKLVASVSLIMLSCFCLFLLVSLSIGGFIGYVSTPSNVDKVIKRFSEEKLAYIYFEVDGISATYDIKNESVDVVESSSECIHPSIVGLGNFSKMAIASLSISSSLVTLEKSFKYLNKLSHVAKNKASRYGLLVSYAGVTLGTICGGFQGFRIGRRLRIEEIHDELMLKISTPQVWQDIYKESLGIQLHNISIPMGNVNATEYYGIGIVYSFNADSSALIVNDFAKISSAKEMGVKIGDKILMVDSMPISSIKGDPQSRIGGADGSTVSLFISRDSKQLNINVRRRKIMSTYTSTMYSDDKENIDDVVSVSNPAVILMQPFDTICPAYQNGIHSQIVILKWRGWDIQQELEPDLMKSVLVQNNMLVHSDTIVFGYWTTSPAMLFPRLEIKMIVDASFLGGLGWKIEAVDRNQYDALRRFYRDWLNRR